MIQYVARPYLLTADEAREEDRETEKEKRAPSKLLKIGPRIFA